MSKEKKKYLKANIIKIRNLPKMLFLMILITENKEVKINIDNRTTWYTLEELREITKDEKNYLETKRKIEKAKDYKEVTKLFIDDFKQKGLGRALTKIKVMEVLLDKEKFMNSTNSSPLI